MPRPRGPLNPEKTRNKIIEAATNAFATRGYQATSLGIIAADVGITSAALLYHFGDKKALFNAVLRSVWGGISVSLESVLTPQASPADLLAVLTVTLMDVNAQQRSLWAQIHGTLLGGSGAGAEAVQDTLLPLIDRIEATLREVFAPLPAAPVREVLIYLQLAHAAQDQLRLLAPGEADRLAAAEPALAIQLLTNVLGPVGDSVDTK